MGMEGKGMLIEDKRYEPSVRDDQGYSEHEMGEMREKKKTRSTGVQEKARQMDGS